MAELLSDVELAEIEARVNAASPGPWTGGTASYGYSIFCPEEFAVAQAIMMVMDMGHNVAKNNAKFIACARDDVPSLLSHIRAQAEELTALRAKLNRYAPPELTDEAVTNASIARYGWSSPGELLTTLEQESVCECSENGRKCRCDARDEDF